MGQHMISIMGTAWRHAGHFAVAFLFIVGATSCARSNMDDLEQFVKETKLKFAGQVESLPAVRPYESYDYGASDKRDPFRSSVSLVKTIAITHVSNGLLPDSVRRKEELEQFELDSLTMVGLLVKEGQNWAIVKAPGGNVARVREGNYIGRNHGKILKISETKIEVKEIVADGLGGWIERPNTLGLKQ